MSSCGVALLVVVVLFVVLVHAVGFGWALFIAFCVFMLVGGFAQMFE